MDASRREFLGQCSAAALTLAAVPHALAAAPVGVPARRAAGAPDWDTSWTKRITGKHRAVFDVPEIESGYGVWRASIWANQYQQVLGAAPKDIATVVVLRHNGISLAMQQKFWDRYGVPRALPVIHPVSEKPTDRNPVLLASSRGEVPAAYDALALDQAIARGVIVLACNLAFEDPIALVVAKDGATPEAARKTALDHLVPGVIMQPSGVFATVLAQESGCAYVRAS
ncbi:hypothetical protein [Roseisolibacter agri]|uniref:Isochorismatase family protein n=1 Tax=Roseisolibacter agri TaxID=2014610 RepID=A0AA37Q0S3_9BACT|nr:hypothetical protein [Roseisolibacter agri]GLC24279.1 hypothetical protein rosag_07920 [Roseisolibacter agri]